jgi:GNAT superfamily N-acetyltransferase
MKIEIRRLTPDLAEDYAHFFDVTPHDDNIDEHKCYCVTWRSDASYDNGNHWFPTREERRRAPSSLSRRQPAGLPGVSRRRNRGMVQRQRGLRLCVDYLRSYWPIEAYRDDVRVKSVFCFMIAPEMHRKGVATRLLERVCADAADDGFDFVEAYINKEFVYTDHDFRGPPAMYEKCGFTWCAEREGKVVMRKALKE